MFSFTNERLITERVFFSSYFLNLFIFIVFSACSGGSDYTRELSLPCSDEERECRVFIPDHPEKTEYAFILLHGFNSTSRFFPSVAPLSSLADKYNAVFVCPNGGRASWYIDKPWSDKGCYAGFIAQGVTSFIDSAFGINKSFIIGTSMGGHGALTLVMKYPEKFHGGASISGITDITRFPKRWRISDILGDFSSNQKLWKSHSFHHLIDKDKLEGKKLILDCGRSDFAIGVNRSTHQKLDSLEIDHEFSVKKGKHNGFYTKKRFPYVLESAVEFMEGMKGEK